MRQVMSGHLFYAGDRAGPMFWIGQHTFDGPYHARIISYMSGELIAERGGFNTVGDAVTWCEGYAEW